MIELSNILENYPRSGIRVMFELAKQYPDAISLTVGQPNFDTPDFIKEAAIESLRGGLTGYVSNGGLPELRQIIADQYTERFGRPFTQNNIMVAAGGMESLFLALVSCVNPGDEVIVPDPGYPNYLGQIALLRGKAVPVPLREEYNFELQPEDLEAVITPKTKAVILNSPSNPTGAFIRKETLYKLAEVIKKHDLYVVSDEVYEYIVYDGNEVFSMAQIPGMEKNVLITNSFSKTYAMTGWRMGYVVADESIVQYMPQLQEALISCVPGFFQVAAVEAIKNGDAVIEEMVGHYARRRNIMWEGLNQIPGISCFRPQGAFYAFANIKSFGKSSFDFAQELLKNAGVVSVPGSAFGEMGEGYIRFSYANSDENLKEALRRMDAYIRKTY